MVSIPYANQKAWYLNPIQIYKQKHKFEEYECKASRYKEGKNCENKREK